MVNSKAKANLTMFCIIPKRIRIIRQNREDLEKSKHRFSRLYCDLRRNNCDREEIVYYAEYKSLFWWTVFENEKNEILKSVAIDENLWTDWSINKNSDEDPFRPIQKFAFYNGLPVVRDMPCTRSNYQRNEGDRSCQ